MGLLSKLLGWDQEKLEREERERRKTEGFTAWHPKYGRVYYPPKQLAGLNEYNGYSPRTEPAFSDDDYFHT